MGMISMLYASKDLQTGNHIQCMDVSSQYIAHTTVSRNYISEMLLITWCLREMCKLTIRLPSRRGQIGTYVELRLFSQARRRKDSPLISAGVRLNSENSPYR